MHGYIQVEPAYDNCTHNIIYKFGQMFYILLWRKKNQAEFKHYLARLTYNQALKKGVFEPSSSWAHQACLYLEL